MDKHTKTADPTNAPADNDPELAKILTNMSAQPDGGGGDKPAASDTSAPQPAAPAEPPADTTPPSTTLPPMPAPPPIDPTMIAGMPLPGAPAPDVPAPVGDVGDLRSIKKAALDELRPIVSKLTLPPKDKFEALLLIIRSSDDQSLIQAAYEAAEGIEDATEKAQALLDIVKEIEYFSGKAAA